MLSIFGGFKGLVRHKKSVIDSKAFQLHYRLTFTILLLASLLTTSFQFFGSPIDCIVDGIPTGVMNTYCWIHGTFTIPAALTGVIGNEVPHPGVAPPSHKPANKFEEAFVKFDEHGNEIRHGYYQWVCFVLFLQAILCYVPHYLWKMAEGGKVRLLLQDLDQPSIEYKKDEVKDRRKALVNYILLNIRTHNAYVYKFLFCEVLNLVNVIAQIYLMNSFFGGQFTTYGTDVINISEQPMEKRFDPMAKVFPKMSKCTFNKYGPSGTIQVHDGLCILPINIINEKIYIFLWFWFMFITVFTALSLAKRFIEVAASPLRIYFLRYVARSSNLSDLRTVLQKCYYGDYFLLRQLAIAIRPQIFHDVIIDLRNRMDGKMSQFEDDEDELKMH